jgi:hypothetical protein
MSPRPQFFQRTFMKLLLLLLFILLSSVFAVPQIRVIQQRSGSSTFRVFVNGTQVGTHSQHYFVNGVRI